MNNTYSSYQMPVQEQPAQRKGFHPFYLFPLLYIFSVYALPFSLVNDITKHIFPVFIILFAVTGIINIIVSCAFCKPENRIMMLNASVLVKYSMIPFFIVGGMLIIFTLLLSVMPVPFMIFVMPVFAGIGAVFGWFVLAPESPYVISYLVLSAKAGVRSSGMAVLHAILQFFFCLDVFDLIGLTFKERKWRELTITIIVLLGLAAILCFAIILFSIIKVRG